MAKWPELLKASVTNEMIQEGKGCNPYKCPWHLAFKVAIGGHGYVRISNGQVAITRRPDYREKGFMPQKMIDWIVAYDTWTKMLKKDEDTPRPSLVRPMTVSIKMYKTRKVGKISEEQRIKYSKRAKETGNAKKRYPSVRERLGTLAPSNP